MGAFLGQLNRNEIYNALFNMIISHEVFDRIGDFGELVDEAKVDGTLYGDTKLYYAADILGIHDWGNDAEAANLLSLDRPTAPECQAITLDVFKQIRLTLDDYLSKRAWSDEGTFGQFNSLMEGMISNTKRIYDVSTYNQFIGTDEVSGQVKEIDLSGATTPEAEGKEIARFMADLSDDMTKISRKYNEYGHVTKFSPSDLKVIWNPVFVNKIRKVDLSGIYHNEGLIEGLGTRTIAAEYFNRAATTDDVGDNKPIPTTGHIGSGNEVVVSKVVKEFVFGGKKITMVPGMPLLEGMVVGTAGAVETPDFAMSEVGIVREDVICKVYVKLPPFMSAFEVGTSFWNARSLTTNRYLTFGHNTLEHLKAYPCVTVKKAAE